MVEDETSARLCEMRWRLDLSWRNQVNDSSESSENHHAYLIVVELVRDSLLYIRFRTSRLEVI